MAKLIDYIFSIGDSNKGQLGFCFTIRAEDRASAIAAGKEWLAAFTEGIEIDNDDPSYPVVYFNTTPLLTVDDIEDESDVEEGD